MALIMGFDHNIRLGLFHRCIVKEALVNDFKDITACFVDMGSNVRKCTRIVTHRYPQAYDSASAYSTSLED